MNSNCLSCALIIAFSAIVLQATAQKTYTQGVISYTTSMRGQEVEVKQYFTTDSIAATFTAGPATITSLSDANHQSFALLLDVPVAAIKKAAVYTPDEVNKQMAAMPAFTFVATAETKKISGFNCNRAVATDTKDNKTYDVWITSDISVPAVAIPVYYQGIGSFPVRYTVFQEGQTSEVIISGVSDGAPPAGIFSIPADFDKITKDDLAAMSGGAR